MIGTENGGRSTLEHDSQRVAQVAGFDWIISIPMNAT